MQTNRQKLPADYEIIMNRLNRSTFKRWSIGTIIFSIMLLLLAFSSCHKTDPKPIPVVKKLDGSVALQNKSELAYTATLSNVNSAKLVVNKDGALVLSEEISDVAASGPDYQMTFKYVKDDPTLKNFTKGKYEFILTSDDFTSDKLVNKSATEISNYLPTANTSTLDQNKLNFNEAFETTLSIPKIIFSDDNPEDNPVSVTGVKSIDGKTTPTITTTSTGYDLNVKSVTGSTGAYQLELDFGSITGGLEKTILSGTIGKDTRIVINARIYMNDTGSPFNLFMTKSDKDNYILEGLNAETAITPSTDPLYDCLNYAWQTLTDLSLNGKILTPSTPRLGKVWLFNNYSGNIPDSVYNNGGTLEKEGIKEAPILLVNVIDASDNYEHEMCAVLTGSDVSTTGEYLNNFYNYNIISPQDKQINVSPGHYRLPLNCNKITISYPLVVEDKVNGNYLKAVDLVKFRLDNGVPTLIWENTDPKYNIIK